MPMEPDADDYAMNKQVEREKKKRHATKAKKQLALKAQVPEGAKKVKIKAKVEMAGKGA